MISENVSMAMGNLEKQNVVMAYMKDYNWALYSDTLVEDTSSEQASNTETAEENTEEETEKADENGIKESDYVIHNEKEAKAVRKKIMDKLDKLHIEYEITTSSEDNCEMIANEIVKEINQNEQ